MAIPQPNDQSAESAPAEQISVTITAVGDGTYTVSMAGDDQEAEDAGQQPEEGGDQPQTADSIDGALEIAKQMLGGEAEEAQAEPEDGNAPLSPADAKSAWKQMASKRDKGGM